MSDSPVLDHCERALKLMPRRIKKIYTIERSLVYDEFKHIYTLRLPKNFISFHLHFGGEVMVEIKRELQPELLLDIFRITEIVKFLWNDAWIEARKED